MAISLYDATVPSYRQILAALGGVLDKAEAFCAEQGVAPEEIIQKRLAEDMHPLAYQVKSASVHSIGAIEGVRAGAFSPDTGATPDSFAGLKDKVAAALEALAAIEPAEMNSFEGRPMRFTIGDRLRLDFTSESFLLSFSQPNFYFHVTTTYAILRAAGVQLGKRDYIGAMRVIA